jgi:stage V sporulation protein D (sporulation-specific penicillin-binding protein)
MAIKRSIILVGFFVLSLVLVFNLGRIQIKEGEYWRALAYGQHNVFIESEGERGNIFLCDKDGNTYPLATNALRYEVFLSPVEIEDSDAVINILTDNLNITKEAVEKKIFKNNSQYELVANKLTAEEIEKIVKANIKGIHVKSYSIRWYPQETLASHVSGFVGGEGIGQYGIEGYYDNLLRGSLSIKKGWQWLTGFFINSDSTTNGDNLNLSIDYNIQFMTEKFLEEGIKKSEARKGTILVGDPWTGQILAMADYPTFNPNNYGQERDLSIFRNGSVQHVFEPGSVFKPITMAIAIEEGRITPETEFNDKGIVYIGSHPIKNYNDRVNGKVTMKEVLALSINTGLVHVENLIGHDTFLDYIEKFGFLERSGIDLAGEEFSRNMEFLKGYEINFATASFGQGIGLNTIQLFRAFSALANGGHLVSPSVTTAKPLGPKVISEKTSATITSMMMIDDGFSRRAAVPGYQIAGKTGTAQVPWSAIGVSKKGYSDETIQSFAGYAPAFSPRFVIIVKLHNPSTTTAEYSAAPIFSELSKYILDYYQIPPDL